VDELLLRLATKGLFPFAFLSRSPAAEVDRRFRGELPAAPK
jgi:hypothetical protein